MFDLHTHSTASDGSFSPSLLIKHAKEAGIAVFALTDHDTTSGLAEATVAAEQEKIKFIPGIELNITYEPGECHLLGLNIQKWHTSEKLADTCAQLTAARYARNQSIIAKMNEAGYSVSLDDISSKTGTVGRPHFARYLVEHHIVKNYQKAFDLYLGKGRPWYQGNEGIPLVTGIEAVLDAGGIPVLAHPLSLYLSWPHLESKLAEWKKLGICGIEAYHSAIRVADALRLCGIAERLGFFVTAGSDFHGTNRPDRKIGCTCGGAKIDAALFASIPAQLQPDLIRDIVINLQMQADSKENPPTAAG